VTAGLRTIDAKVSRLIVLFGIAMTVLGLILTIGAGRGEAATAPTLSITPSTSSGPYHDGETVSIAVGSNSQFAPYSRIEIIECAAPHGQLPVDDTTCDGNTVADHSILVNKDGSFSDSSYTLYQLPNPVLGEQSNDAPVCNATSECVLYIGQNQNDFTQPKVFSAPFTIESGGAEGSPTATTQASPDPGAATAPRTGTTATGGGSAGTTGTSTSGSSGDVSGGPGSTVGGKSGSLAFTGPPTGLQWLIAIGLSMVIVGVAGRRLGRRVSA
jgi:hypothetical protein